MQCVTTVGQQNVTPRLWFLEVCRGACYEQKSGRFGVSGYDKPSNTQFALFNHHIAIGFGSANLQPAEALSLTGVQEVGATHLAVLLELSIVYPALN